MIPPVIRVFGQVDIQVAPIVRAPVYLVNHETVAFEEPPYGADPATLGSVADAQLLPAGAPHFAADFHTQKGRGKARDTGRGSHRRESLLAYPTSRQRSSLGCGCA